MAKLARAWRWSRGRGWPALLVLVGAMLIFRLVWGWVVQKQVEGRLAQLRARGEPATMKEVPYPSLSDSDNAWKFQLKAINAINPAVDCPRSSNLEYSGPPYPPEWMKLAAASEQAHGQVFALLRAARPHPAAQFRKELVGISSWGDIAYLNQIKHLANIVVDGAEYAHFTGNSDEAVERLLDVLHLARSMRQDDYF